MFSRLRKSVHYAIRGIYDVAQSEQNFRIQLIFGGCAIMLSWIISFAAWERIVIALLVLGVLVLEIMNSVLERFADALHPRLHGTMREVKDMMAGSVLLTALAAFGIGGALFLPHILALFSHVVK